MTRGRRQDDSVTRPLRRLWAIAFAMSLLWSLPGWLVVHSAINTGPSERASVAADLRAELTGRTNTIPAHASCAWAGSGSFLGIPESEAALYRVRPLGPICVPTWVQAWDGRILLRVLAGTVAISVAAAGGAYLGIRAGRRAYRGYLADCWRAREGLILHRTTVAILAGAPILGCITWWAGVRRGFSPITVLWTGAWWFDPAQAKPGGNPIAELLVSRIDRFTDSLANDVHDHFVPTAEMMGVGVSLLALAAFIAARLCTRHLAASLRRSAAGGDRACPSCGYPAGAGPVCSECGRAWAPSRPAGRVWPVTRLTALCAVGAVACIYAHHYPFDASLAPSALWRWATFQGPAPWNYGELTRRSRLHSLDMPHEGGAILTGREGSLQFATRSTTGVTAYAWRWIPHEPRAGAARVRVRLADQYRSVQARGRRHGVPYMPIVMGGPGLYVEYAGSSFVQFRGTAVGISRISAEELATDAWRDLSDPIDAALSQAEPDGPQPRTGKKRR